jgi:hypothetical protein
MKKGFLLLGFTAMATLTCSAQDKIMMRDSTLVEAKVLTVDDEKITFSYPNEDVVNEKKRGQIAYIIYSSGRREVVSKPIEAQIITDKSDWDKVVVTYNPEDVKGLIKGKTLMLVTELSTAEASHELAIERLKKIGAKHKFGVILVNSETYRGTFDRASVMSYTMYKVDDSNINVTE